MGFKAGVAEVNITPPVGISLCGFAGRKGPSESIHDDLYARALVLDSDGTRLVIVTADVISFSPDLVKRIREDLSECVPATHLLLNGSHSHSGPTVMAFRSMGDRDDSYEDVLCRKIAGAVKMAVDSLMDVHLFEGRAPVRIGYNRREKREGRIILGHHPEGPEAPWVDVLRLDRSDGTTIGLVYATAAHPVNLHGLSVSAEFPGYAARFISRNLDGAIPIFAQACCGDINCEPMDGTHDCSLHIGTLLGNAALHAAMQASPVEETGLDSICETIQLPLSVPDLETAQSALEHELDQLSTARKNGIDSPYTLRHRYEDQVGWARAHLDEARKGEQGQSVDFEIQVMRIGSMAVIAFPGEMFVNYQLTMEERSPFDKTVTLGYSNGCIGYVPTADAYQEGGYEIERAFRYYGTLMIGPECETMIKHQTLSMLEELKA